MRKAIINVLFSLNTDSLGTVNFGSGECSQNIDFVFTNENIYCNCHRYRLIFWFLWLLRIIMISITFAKFVEDLNKWLLPKIRCRLWRKKKKTPNSGLKQMLSTNELVCFRVFSRKFYLIYQNQWPKKKERESKMLWVIEFDGMLLGRMRNDCNVFRKNKS